MSTIRRTGVVDAHAAIEMRNQAETLFDNGCDEIHFDLGTVTSFHLNGVAALLFAVRTGRQRGVAVRITPPREMSARRPIDLVGLMPFVLTAR